MICSIYARNDGTLAHVWDSSFMGFTPDVNSTLIIEFSIDDYPTEYQFIASNSASAFWNSGTGALEIPQGVVYVDSAWIAARQAEIAAQETIAAAQSGLLDKIALAEQFASDIKTLYNAVLDQTENQTVQPDRFNTLFAVVQAAPLAFRNRLITDCEQELGFNPSGALTANQQRQATLYLRVWITALALLLMARKVL